MSRIILTKGSGPVAPSAGKVSIYADSGDLGRIKARDGDSGLVSILSPNDLDRNFLINGGFDIAQRQAPGTLTTLTGTAISQRGYGADRWTASVENASGQYQRVDSIAATETGLFARYYGKWKKITSTGKMTVTQVIEASNHAPLRGRVVRLQLKMKYSVAGSMTVRVGLFQLTAAGAVDTMPGSFFSAANGNGTDPTLGTNIAKITPDSADNAAIASSALTCVLSSSWQRFGGTFLVPTDCKNLIVGVWTHNQLAANDELNIAEAGLYDGTDIIDWLPLSVDREILRCQRYYAKTFSIDVAPAQNAGLGGALRVPCTTAGAVATSIVGNWRFPVRLRIPVTATVFYNPSAVNANARNVTLATDATATNAADASDIGLKIACTGLAAWAVGNDIAIHLSTDVDFT